MAKIKNKTFTSTDRELLQRLADELEFLGRHYTLNLKAGTLTQHALPPQAPKRAKQRRDRDKRSEKFERRS